MAHSHLPALGSEPQGFGSQLGAMQPPAKRARTEPGWCISPSQAAELQQYGPGFLKMLVTNNTAGILIGKGGSALKDLEASTGCLVRLSPANNFYPGSGQRVVCVAGKQEAVEAVLAAVVEATMEVERHQAAKESREPEDRVLAQIALPFSACGLVIGKGGVTQKEITEQTGRYALQLQITRILSKPRESFRGKKQDPFDLRRGTSQLWSNAQLLSKAFGGPPVGITVKITPQGQNTVQNERLASLQGPSRGVALAATQVFRLVQADPNMAQLETPAEGSAAQAPQAQSNWSGRWEQRSDYSPAPPAVKPMGKGAMRMPAMSAPPASAGAGLQCQIFFEVSDMEAAHIIGKGGTFLQSVCQQTNAKVQLTKRGEQVPGTENRLVTVSGLMQNVHAAHAMVVERAASTPSRRP
ncbi:unnamed protein product [Effrenium voratum]|uniref:K Homology domain-containing protein n=1 Tax=Effrenium voratum TaxID=2562239 RepID=A0AA36JA31_9DINO|nr:unnamed protein product [Effrenium voratum]CAJ1401832.1 unnamed protein product [Effrenium voratum]